MVEDALTELNFTTISKTNATSNEKGMNKMDLKTRLRKGYLFNGAKVVFFYKSELFFQ